MMVDTVKDLRVKSAPIRKRRTSGASMKDTIPGIYLIESSYRDDEQNELRERYVIEEILRLAGGRLQHHYIRTRKEFKYFIAEFQESRFHYLHLACHGDLNGVGLTYDSIPFSDLADILSPAMDHRRLFVSACDCTRSALARPLFRKSTCYSVVGSRSDIRFHDAAISWAVFYSLMAKTNRKAMKQAAIRTTLQAVCDLFDVSFNAFFNINGTAQLVVFRGSKRS
jgi:hypothetical protein